MWQKTISSLNNTLGYRYCSLLSFACFKHGKDVEQRLWGDIEKEGEGIWYKTGKKQTKKPKAQQTNKKTHSRTKQGEKTWISNTLCCCCLVAKSCPTLFDPVGCRPPGSSVHGIFQARKLEWVVISFSRGSSQPRDWTCVSCIGRWMLNHCATREAQTRWKLTQISNVLYWGQNNKIKGEKRNPTQIISNMKNIALPIKIKCDVAARKS